MATLARSALRYAVENNNNVQRLGFLCYSCASTSYLQIWNQHLLGHYFPPKNFTDSCWKPGPEVGVHTCSTACFTIVEEIFGHTNREAVMRGCIDRLLLFGLDDDIKTAISQLGPRSCRTIDRHLLNLVSLSDNVPLVLMCSCTGNMCNSDEVQNTTNSVNICIFLVLLLLCLIIRR
ncbi:unnamed protein product [Bursaphelenchus okinawaensis]|uniref:Uncharacterized protein n=1 Tax=Bursaphelenchus okinawaensis TaxID=465554 RepID=A0A811KEN9_9BILA|nr:unnamed protein product [Bursaphelenchus okinawaensis]CAG9103282.1 unnamed protein product [Bursaphelenchus okinawaensis]